MKTILFPLMGYALLGASVAFEASATEPSEAEVDRYLTTLYTLMNPADSLDRTAEFYRDNAIIPALKAREEMPWGKKVPELEFVHFVMPLRVNNEAIDAHRPVFYAELKNRVKDLSMKDAILEINHWLHEKATYQPSDSRTHSPLQTVSSAIGRCGEESTFGVAALRAMGIPARQVYTPRWAHTDDNHAWVEAWADGKWYFLGACEPEPVLNLGWFNLPATRAMLMHARVPGSNYNGPEEVLARFNGNTDINVTSNYAPVDTLRVGIVDVQGKAVENAEVTFCVYNYAEFYPMVSKTTDGKGEASIVGGLGDLLVWATDGNLYGFRKAKVGTDRHVTVTLAPVEGNLSLPLDVTPPAEGKSTAHVTDEMRAMNTMRMAYEDSIRGAYTATFPTPDIVRAKAEELGVDEGRLTEIVRLSRGNHSTILAFLTETAPGQRQKAMDLLGSLSDKDLTDVGIDVLRDHIAAEEIETPLFAQYVMSPRIYAEELTPFRAPMLKRFGPRAAAFRKNPESWVKYVMDSIDGSLSWYPSSATMSPLAVDNVKKTSALSRDIYFVAGARAFGIPARIDRVTGKTQYADKDGNWVDVPFYATDIIPTTSAPKGRLRLEFTPTAIVDDPKYFTNFTLSKIEYGVPQLLNYPEFIPWSQSFKESQELDAGEYMLTTGQRLADGSVLSEIEIFTIPEGEEVVMPLTLRQDTTAIQVIGSFNAENRFMKEGDTEPSSILANTGRGYYVLGILKAGNEPSTHAVRDLGLERQQLEEIGRPIVLIADDRSRYSTDDIAALPDNVIWGTEPEGIIASELIENLKLPANERPIFVIADTFNRVVFVSAGYTIGLGHKIADILKRLSAQ